MPRLPQKALFRCPGCGFAQLEPPHLISTFCQSCGGHYEVQQEDGTLPSPFPPAPAPRSASRAVLCYRCGKTHHVSPHAVNTLCPCCNSAIDLADMEILAATSCRVDTRGRLVIGPAGSLSSSWIICGSADIEGRIVGILRAEGEVHLATSGACACQMTASSVVVAKNVRAKITLPLETGHLEVRGHLAGIVHCRGDVHVRRGGRLEAEVFARSVKVDKGGALLGVCHVNGTRPDEPGRLLPPTPRDALWSEHLCPAC
ncbi:MAG: polymer-forming cytoskeletal protein [Terrimicrobiaceae bacterium]